MSNCITFRWMTNFLAFLHASWAMESFHGRRLVSDGFWETRRWFIFHPSWISHFGITKGKPGPITLPFLERNTLTFMLCIVNTPLLNPKLEALRGQGEARWRFSLFPSGTFKACSHECWRVTGQNPSSETQGQIVGARESLNGRENMARRKVKNGEKSPWGQCLTRLVPNGRCRSGFWLVPIVYITQ